MQTGQHDSGDSALGWEPGDLSSVLFLSLVPTCDGLLGKSLPPFPLLVGELWGPGMLSWPVQQGGALSCIEEGSLFTMQAQGLGKMGWL